MWSTTVVAGAVLFLELLPDHGVPLYLADPAGPCTFLQARWTKGLRLTAGQWRHAIAERGVPCAPTLGRVFRWSATDVTWRCGPRDPDVLRRYAAELAALADALGVAPAELGVCGSALYKPDDQQGDFDFVVFEHGGRRPAWAAACRLAGGCHINGVAYHLRFRLPGINRWCDPHFTGPCPMIEAMITGHAMSAGVSELAGQAIVSAAHGHHTPAHYELASGRHLVSFRFGHSGLFDVGDRLTTDHALQLFTWDGVTSFVVCDGDHQLEVLKP